MSAALRVAKWFIFGVSQQPKIRVGIVEDYAPLLQGLKKEIENTDRLCCVGIFEMCEDALKAMPEMQANVILMDLKLPLMDGFECTRQFKKGWPRVKVLVFSASDSDEDIVTAFGAGCDGYVVKETNPHELEQNIISAFDSEWPMSWRVRRTMAVYAQWRARLLPMLSPRERQVFELVERGFQRKQIADRLGISFSTVKTHMERIFAKGEVTSAREALYRLRGQAAA